MRPVRPRPPTRPQRPSSVGKCQAPRARAHLTAAARRVGTGAPGRPL